MQVNGSYLYGTKTSMVLYGTKKMTFKKSYLLRLLRLLENSRYNNVSCQLVSNVNSSLFSFRFSLCKPLTSTHGRIIYPDVIITQTLKHTCMFDY